MTYDEEVYDKLFYNFGLLCEIIKQNSSGNEMKVDLSKIENIINNKIPETLKKNAPEDFYELYIDFKSEYEKFRDFILYDKLIGKNIIALGGGFSSGKSSFLNALMGKSVLPADIDPSTSVPTYIVKGEKHEVEGINVFDSKVKMQPKKLVLIASKYDSGIRDVLRVQDEDDIFGDDDNTADNIPKACKIIKKKLRKRAKSKVDEFVKDLESRDSSSELIEVIKQCSDPIMVSSLVYNMTNKSQEEYTSEEKNIYSALKQFSDDMEKDLTLLGNFDEVKCLFNEVVREKEEILEAKAKSFIPNAHEELKDILSGYLEKTKGRIQILQNNDKNQLEEQRKIIENQIGAVKAEIATVFGELKSNIELEKSAGIRELRDISKDYLNVKERTGSITRTGSYTTGHLWWKKTHEYNYEEHYSYCIAADAIENLQKYSLEASNEVEERFIEAIHIKELKRKLMNVVVNNFDLGSEKFDSQLFKIMLENTVNDIEIPVFNIDISSDMSSIAGKFNGELTSADQKNELSIALSKAISAIYDVICKKFESSVKKLKDDISEIEKKIEDTLLTNILKEFEELKAECDNKEKEITAFREYETILENEIKILK